MVMISLAQARVNGLKARKAAFDVRDRKLRDFDVRVLPAGRIRFFIHCQHHGKRAWKIVSDAGTVSVEDARVRENAMLAMIRWEENGFSHPCQALFEAVAETVFERYRPVWMLFGA